MKRIILFSTLIMLFYSTRSQTLNASPTAKLAVLENTSFFTGCGVVAWAYGLKFRLINTNSSFVVLIKCPEAYGNFFFVRGNKFLVETAKINNMDSAFQGYMVVNPYQKENLPTYSLISIKKRK